MRKLCGERFAVGSEIKRKEDVEAGDAPKNVSQEKLILASGVSVDTIKSLYKDTWPSAEKDEAGQRNILELILRTLKATEKEWQSAQQLFDKAIHSTRTAPARRG